MSKSNKGGPIFRIGVVICAPPGMSVPPVIGFTPFWEKEMGLLYVMNNDSEKIDLTIGQIIQFEIITAKTPSKTTINIAHNITNL